jgi:hypothetical protein
MDDLETAMGCPHCRDLPAIPLLDGIIDVVGLTTRLLDEKHARGEPLALSAEIHLLTVPAFEGCLVHHLVEVHGVPVAQAAIRIGRSVAQTEAILGWSRRPVEALAPLGSKGIERVALAVIEGCLGLTAGFKAASASLQGFGLRPKAVSGHERLDGEVYEAVQQIINDQPDGTQGMSPFDLQAALSVCVGRRLGAEILASDVLPPDHRARLLAGRLAGIDMAHLPTMRLTRQFVLMCLGWPAVVVNGFFGTENLQQVLFLCGEMLEHYSARFDVLTFDGHDTYGAPAVRAMAAGAGKECFAVRFSCQNPAEYAIRRLREQLPVPDKTDGLHLPELVVGAILRLNKRRRAA